MQHEYLSRLSEPVQKFVHDVEEGAGVDIQVILDYKQNDGGSTGQGKLAVNINARSIKLFIPTNGYFPDGAVRHEVLHVLRFHVMGVPKLALADSEEWDRAFSDAVGALDNAIEHVLIVPVELQHHPERSNHWEAVMQDVCLGLQDIPVEERRLAVCMHWTFLRHVLPQSYSIEILRDFAMKHGLLKEADEFADKFISLADSKEDLVRLLLNKFPKYPRERVAFEYVNSRTGTIQKSIF